MARYIDADKLIETNRVLLEHAQMNGMYNHARIYERFVHSIEDTPDADVVPKSEVEQLVQDGTRLVQENETLKDNNEHLAVMLEEAKSEVDKWYYEYHAIKDELKQERLYHKATEKLADKYCVELITAKSEVAREIFAEIETAISGEIEIEEKALRASYGKHAEAEYKMHEYAEDSLITLRCAFALLEKKYTEEKKNENQSKT